MQGGGDRGKQNHNVHTLRTVTLWLADLADVRQLSIVCIGCFSQAVPWNACLPVYVHLCADVYCCCRCHCRYTQVAVGQVPARPRSAPRRPPAHLPGAGAAAAGATHIMGPCTTQTGMWGGGREAVCILQREGGGQSVCAVKVHVGFVHLRRVRGLDAVALMLVPTGT